MRNQSMDKSHLDSKLKQVDKDIMWNANRKSKLKNELFVAMDRVHPRAKLVAGLKYASSIGVLVILLLAGYHFLSDSITHQSGENYTDNQGNQPTHQPIIDEQEEETPDPSDSTDGLEEKETIMEVQIGSAETVMRIVEGMDQEVKVINYQLEHYGIAYQLDEVFGAPEVIENQLTYSTQQDEYKLNLEVLEHTTLEQAVSSLQERMETEGYNEKFELESTPAEENDLNGKMQFYVSPVKGFIAYEMDEHVLAITFQYPEEGGDGMYPLLKALRESIEVR